MLRPIIRLATERPDWLTEHLLAYGELAGEEIGQAAAEWRRRLAWQLGALVLGAIAFTLAGVALLIGSVAPTAPAANPTLWLVPSLPALAALGCALAARPQAQAASLERLRNQLHADAVALQEATR